MPKKAWKKGVGKGEGTQIPKSLRLLNPCACVRDAAEGFPGNAAVLCDLLWVGVEGGACTEDQTDCAGTDRELLTFFGSVIIRFVNSNF